VVVLIGEAPWHAGEPVTETLAGRPNVGRKRPPGDRPRRNGIERSWEGLRRRARHDRTSDAPSDLQGSIRNRPRYFPTVRRRLTARIAACHPPPVKQTTLTGT
jgi:hypothetical protein